MPSFSRRPVSRLVPLLLAIASTLTAATAGEITSPAPGACLGWDDVPVAIEDSFEPGLPRHLDPGPPEPHAVMTRLMARNREGGDFFGRALAVDGDRLYVGRDGGGDGSVVVFERREGRFVEVGSIAVAGSRSFGRALALDGGTLVVGAHRSIPIETRTGVVSVHDLDGDARRPVATLLSPEPGSDFGSVVALHRDLLCVGAPLSDRDGTDVGAAYLFERDDDGWRQVARLAPDPPEGHDRFGMSCAVDGDTVAVGATGPLFPRQAGRVYVFRRGSAGWLRDAVLDAGPLSRPADEFGAAVAIEGPALAVGSPAIHERGRVHVFETAGGDWIPTVVLEGDPGSQRGRRFGHDVRWDGDRMLVGAVFDRAGLVTTGAAYAFRRDGAGAWQREQRWESGDRTAQDNFGHAIAPGDGFVVFGAPYTEQNGFATGTVYVAEGPPTEGYRTHGDLRVRLTVDEPGGPAGVEVGFTVDLVPPRVERIAEGRTFLPPVAIAAGDLFSSHDVDGAAGGVVRERVLLDRCPVFDGATYGDGDGLLSDEILVLDADGLCAALARCEPWRTAEPRLRVEATDCGGNVGTASSRTTWDPAADCAADR